MLANVFAARISVWRTCVFVLVMVGLLACQVSAVNTITSMVVTNKPDCVTISVEGTEALKMSPLKASRYLGFQFAGRMVAKGGLKGIHSGRIQSIRYSRFCENPPQARVVVNTTGHLDYSTAWSSDKTRVVITVWKFGAKPASSAPAKSIEKLPAVIAAAPVSDLPVLPPAEICGPQGSDPGTPDLEPVRLAAAPMRTAGPASVAPVRVAQVIEEPVARPAAERKVSLNFLGADINDVLKALASQSGQNIVAGKDVKGEITVSLTNVTLDEALDYVAKLSGFGYTKSNGTYLIGAKDSIKAVTGEASFHTTTEVVPVKYTNVDDVLALLKTQCPDVQATKISLRSAGKPASAGGPQPDSSIVLSGAAESIAAAKLLVQQVDVPVEKEQLVYKVQYVAPDLLAAAVCKLVPGISVDGLGIAPAVAGQAEPAAAATESPTMKDASALSKDEGLRNSGTDQTLVKQQRPMNYTQLDSVSRSIVVTGSKAQVEKARELLVALDVKSRQIKIDAKITSLTESAEKKLGLSWNWGDLSVLEDVSAPLLENNEDYSEPVAVSANVSVNRSLNRYWRQPLKFGATLDALITNGDGQLLASPSLVCLEGKPGQFFVGDQIRYVVLVQQTPQGNNVETETANVGVQLTVIGQVSDDGLITLNLHPEVSVVRLSVDREAGITLPTITRRYTDHVVRVKAGQTIVIGGLISQNDIDTMKKVPLLGDLPILGHLFRHRDKIKDRSEVVIFITASVVDD